MNPLRKVFFDENLPKCQLIFKKLQTYKHYVLRFSEQTLQFNPDKIR